MRRDSSFFAELGRKLGGIPGISGVQTNPLTGSVLILHTAELQAVAQQVAAQGAFRLASPEVENFSIQTAAARGFQGASRDLRVISGGTVDLSSLLFLGLAGLAVRQAIQGNLLAPAVPLAWYALSVLQLEHNAPGMP